MTVQRIAKKKADTVSIDQFIEKGGKPPCEINEKDKEVKITHRLPKISSRNDRWNKIRRIFKTL